MNPFEQLLKELGLIMNLHLKPDSHGACLLEFEKSLTIQIEHEENLNRLLLGSQIMRLNPGPFREKVFKQAMKANAELHFGKGIFAYSKKNDTLVLFDYLPFASMNGLLLSQAIEAFLNRLKTWTNALKRGDIPELETNQQSKESLFGIRP